MFAVAAGDNFIARTGPAGGNVAQVRGVNQRLVRQQYQHGVCRTGQGARSNGNRTRHTPLILVVKH
jgi:hypothetical protein